MADGVASRWNGVAYPAQDERRIHGAFLAAGGSIRGRAGRRPGPGLTLTVGGSPEAATLTAGVGVVNTATDSDGSYPFAIPASASKNLAARPSAGTSRIDLVVVRILDADIPALGTALKELNMEIVTGTAGASPVAPAVPAGAVALFQLTVPATGSVAVQDVSTFSVAAGGILPVRTTAERNALIPYAGLMVFNMQTIQFESYNGTTWMDGAATGPVPHLVRNRSVDAGLPPAAWTTLSLDQSDQADARFSYSAGVITVPQAGVYSISAGIGWAGTSGGRRGVRVIHNGTNVRQNMAYLAGGSSIQINTALTRRLASGDTIRIEGYQESDASLNYLGGVASTSCAITWVGR